ncbi:MAG: tetratricopeptide repeat protein, partial [Planctomycetota bacterium]
MVLAKIGVRVRCVAVLAALFAVATPIAHAGCRDGASQAVDERASDLDEVEAFLAAGDRDGASAALVAWIEPGFDARAADLDDDARLALARRVDDLAKRLGLDAIVLEARSAIHAQLERTRPPEDDELLGAKLDLGAALFARGEPDAARELFERVIAVWERTKGPDASELVRVRLILGAALCSLGDFARGADLFEVARDTAVRTLPADHHLVLLATQNLALVRDRLGDVPAAVELWSAIVDFRERHRADDVAALLDAKESLAMRQR